MASMRSSAERRDSLTAVRHILWASAVRIKNRCPCCRLFAGPAIRLGEIELTPWIVVTALLFLSVIEYFVFGGGPGGAQPIRSSFAGTLGSPGGDRSTAMLRGAEMYIEEINRGSGIDGRVLVVHTFDDRNDPQEAARIAERICKTHRNVVAIARDRLY